MTYDTHIAYREIGGTDLQNERFGMRADPAMREKLDAFRRAHPGLPSRSESVRILVDLGLEAWRAGQASPGVEPPTPTPSKARKNPRKDTAGPFDRSTYQREYMRDYRAGKAKGSKVAEKPPAAVSGAATVAQAPSPAPEPPKGRRKPSGEASTMTEAEFAASPIGAFIAAAELPGIKWPPATKGHEERLAAMVRKLRPRMSARKVRDAIEAEAGVRVSHAFVEALARAQGVSTAGAKNMDGL